METLQTKTFDVPVGSSTITCHLKERDFGDYIVYDVQSEQGDYLFTISKNGDVLFNESDVTQQKDIMDPRELNEVIEFVKGKIVAELE
jgi:hypothetical protein